MAEQAREDAIAFIEAMRLTLEGKVGFKWMAEKLSWLEEFVSSLQAENARLRTYIGEKDMLGDYEAYAAAHRSDADAAEGPAPGAPRRT